MFVVSSLSATVHRSLMSRFPIVLVCVSIRTESNAGITDMKTSSSALKDLARILRWRVLAEKPHSIHEVDLILSAESLTKLVRLWCGHVKDMFGEACRWSAKFRDTKYRSRPHLSELGQKHHDPAGPGSTPVRVSSKNDQSPKSGKIMRDLIWSLSKISAWLLINIVRSCYHTLVSL